LNKRLKNRKFCSPLCASTGRRVVMRPTREQLSEEMKCSSWIALGNKYGVSDSAVRKWAKRYQLL
jgi:hypothetical protein